MLLLRLFFIVSLFSVGASREGAAADYVNHPCVTAPEDLGLEPFPAGFNPCWHNDFPGGSFWPDGVDFLNHITDQAHQGRMKPSLRANIREAMIRAKCRTFQNPQYVVHSCYYYQHPVNPMYNRWVHNFLIPMLCTAVTIINTR